MWFITFSVAVSIGMLGLFVILFNHSKMYLLKMYGIFILALLLWQNFPNFVYFDKSETEFVGGVLRQNNSTELKVAAFWVPRYNYGIWAKDQNIYSPFMSMFPMLEIYRPVSLTMTETQRDSLAIFDLPIQKMIHNSEIFRFIQSQKNEGSYRSDSESKLKVLRSKIEVWALSVRFPHDVRAVSGRFPTGLHALADQVF